MWDPGGDLHPARQLACGGWGREEALQPNLCHPRGGSAALRLEGGAASCSLHPLGRPGPSQVL